MYPLGKADVLDMVSVQYLSLDQTMGMFTQPIKYLFTIKSQNAKYK